MKKEELEDKAIIKTFFRTAGISAVSIALVAGILYVIARMVKSPKDYIELLAMTNGAYIIYAIGVILKTIFSYIYLPLSIIISVGFVLYAIISLCNTFNLFIGCRRSRQISNVFNNSINNLINEQYRDNNGNLRTRTTKQENTISDEKTSQEISMVDNSTNEPVVLEINGTGCNLDIPKTFDRFEPKANLGNYRYFNSFSWNRYGSETLGFKMIEKTIEANQNLYVIGEAFKVGNIIHIGKPQDNKKPFIVTTKSEEDLINSSNQKSLFLLIGGLIAIAVGIGLLFSIIK